MAKHISEKYPKLNINEIKKKPVSQRDIYGLDEEYVFEVLCQMKDAYKILHDGNFIHRDIKPENILIKGNKFKLGKNILLLIFQKKDFWKLSK